MKKTYLSRFLSVTLAFALVFSSIDMTGYAAEMYQEEVAGDDTGENLDDGSESDVTVSESDYDTEDMISDKNQDTESSFYRLENKSRRERDDV